MRTTLALASLANSLVSPRCHGSNRAALALSVALLHSLGGCSGDEGPRKDAGQPGEALDDGSAGDGDEDGNGKDDEGDGDDPGDGDGDTCARADVKVTRHPPTVWLLVDRSLALGTQNDGQGGSISVYTSMWRDMMGPSGTVTQLQGSVRFGLMLTGVNNYLKPACPNLSVVEPALDNRAAIAAGYPESVSIDGGLFALTHYGLDSLLTRAKRSSDPAELGSTAAIVLIPQAGEQLCLDEGLKWGNDGVRANDETVKALAALGVRTFVLGSDIECTTCPVPNRERLDRLAMLGGSGHEPFLVGQAGDITKALGEITSNLIGCEVALEGKVAAGQECSGEVEVDGKRVACNDANGWKLRGQSSIEFVGEACAELKKKPEAQIKARFPCDVIVLF